MGNNQVNQKIKIISCIVAITVIVIIIWTIVDLVSKKDKVVIMIKVAPSDSKIFIDDKQSSTGRVYIKPGKHTFSARRNGFTDDTRTIDIKKNGNSTILLLPEPSSSSATSLLKSNDEERAKRQELIDEAVEQHSEAVKTKTPLVKILPYITTIYRIDYGPSRKTPSDDTTVAIYISSNSEENKQKALSFIRYKGYNPDELEIIYQSFSDLGD